MGRMEIQRDMLAFLQSANAQPLFRTGAEETRDGASEPRPSGRVIHVNPDAWPSELATLANRITLPRSELLFCGNADPITLRFPESDFIRVQFGLAGSGLTRVGSECIAIKQNEACVSASAAEIAFGRDFRQMVWRIRRPLLNKAIATLTDAPITRAATFEPQIDLSRSTAQVMLGLFRLILQSLVDGMPSAGDKLLSELEQTLIISFLRSTAHNYRDLIERRPPSPACWQVKRAEEYIAAHWDQPISIEDIAAATGAGARSVFRAFKRDRGCSPLEFARKLRLQKAREMLEQPDPALTATSVALQCGYSDLAHLSREFSAAYGERPSEVLNRRASVRVRRTIRRPTAA